MVPSEWSGAEDQLLSVGLRQRQASKDRCSSRNTAQIMRVVWVLFADRPAVARLVSASLPFPAALLENNLIWFPLFLCWATFLPSGPSETPSSGLSPSQRSAEGGTVPALLLKQTPVSMSTTAESGDRKSPSLCWCGVREQFGPNLFLRILLGF